MKTLCGIWDNHQILCFALALWNGEKPKKGTLANKIENILDKWGTRRGKNLLDV